MQNRNLTNFDITVRTAAHNEQQPPYAVGVSYHGHTTNGLLHEDVSDPFWLQMRALLADPLQTPGHQAIVDAGSRLFHTLMQGTVRDLWVRARTDLETGAVSGIRIRLALQPPPVAALPWECLYDPDRNEAFAANGQTPLFRVESLYHQIGATRPLQATLPIKVLLAVPADPTGQIDEEQEIARLTKLFDSLGVEQIQLQTLTGCFDVVALRRQLDESQPDILHIISHGQPDGILFWQHNEPIFTPPSSLRVVLQRAESVKLAILNACLAGSSSEHTAFTTVGPQLLQAGVPAVIAMQFEIEEQTAIDFAHYLYEELITGLFPGAIDTAIGYTRNNLYALNPNSFGYGTPVLWLNAEDGMIFSLSQAEIRAIKRNQRAAHKKDQAKAAEDHASSAKAEEEDQYFAQKKVVLAAVADWLQTLPTRDEATLSGDLLHYTNLRNRHVGNLRDLFQQIQSLEADAQTAPNRQAWQHQWAEKATQIQQEQTKIEQLEALLSNHSTE